MAFRLDRNDNGGGIMPFVREDIPAKLIASETSLVESLYVDVKPRKQKWLINCSYNCDIGKTRITSYEFKSTSYKFKSTSYELKSTSYEFKSTSYEFKFTSYEFKSKNVQKSLN